MTLNKRANNKAKKKYKKMKGAYRDRKLFPGIN